MFWSGTVTSFCEKHVLTLIITSSAAVMDDQDPSMFGMFGITSSMMELLCCVPVKDSNKLL